MNEGRFIYTRSTSRRISTSVYKWYFCK